MVQVHVSDEARDYVREQTDTITLVMENCGG